MEDKREEVYHCLEEIQQNPTPKYFSHLEARIDAFFGEDGEDGQDIIIRTGRLMANL